MNFNKLKTGLLALLLTIGLVSCETHTTPSVHIQKSGGILFKRLPPCGVAEPHLNCELKETYYTMSSNPSVMLTENTEYGPEGTANGLAWHAWDAYGVLYCFRQGRSVASYAPISRYSTASSPAEVRKICEPIRQEVQRKISNSVADSVKTRLDACDSFGFERGTEAHAECAMKLYMNEQHEGVTRTSSRPNAEQAATLARQQAIQEATLKEQKRIKNLEASLKMMQFGVNLMNGTTSQTTTSKTHSQTYTINGQIIVCTTTGLVTTCF